MSCLSGFGGTRIWDTVGHTIGRWPETLRLGLPGALGCPRPAWPLQDPAEEEHIVSLSTRQGISAPGGEPGPHLLDLCDRHRHPIPEHSSPPPR